MLPQSVVALSAFGYLFLLFAIAYYGDWRRARGRSVIANPYIYTLSLAVYCTSWTFYGSVGKAATEGISFLSIYLGPTIIAFFWWFILRKLLRICKENNLTTISDFLTLRFGKGPFLGGLVTVGVLLAIVPYIGLQLKSVVRYLQYPGPSCGHLTPHHAYLPGYRLVRGYSPGSFRHSVRGPPS